MIIFSALLLVWQPVCMWRVSFSRKTPGSGSPSSLWTWTKWVGLCLTQDWTTEEGNDFDIFIFLNDWLVCKKGWFALNIYFVSQFTVWHVIKMIQTGTLTAPKSYLKKKKKSLAGKQQKQKITFFLRHKITFFFLFCSCHYSDWP